MKMHLRFMQPDRTSCCRSGRSFSGGRRLATGNFRQGFTFTEILFAVILLGIGFIMLAGMFPVAIQQTTLAVDETSGDRLAKDAAAFIGQVCTRSLGNPNFDDLPDTGGGMVPITPFSPNPTGAAAPPYISSAWRKISGQMISAQNPRFAWIPFYRRNVGDGFAQLVIVVVRARNYASYGPNDLIPVSKKGLVTLQPREVQITDLSRSSTGGPTTVTLLSLKDVTPNDLSFVGEGSYIVIRRGTDNTPGAGQAAAGRVYRLGAQVVPASGPATTSGTWELLPGNEPLSADEYLLPARNPNNLTNGAFGYVIGRGYRDPNPIAPDLNYDGQAQDVAVYSTFIMLK